MARSLRIRPRLSRTMLSMTKEAASFVCAASCNNNATNRTDFCFPLFLVALLVLYHTPCILASTRLIPDPNILFAEGVVQKWSICLQWGPDP